MKRLLVGLCGLVLIIIVTACGESSENNNSSRSGLQEGSTIQQVAGNRIIHFALPSAIDGTVVDSNDFQGKIRLINFFATWCPPCIEEVPSLIDLQEKYGPKGFSVIGLSVDQGKRQLVKKFVKKMGINYPVLMADDAVAKGFGGITGIPVVFLVNRDDTLIRKYLGYVDHAVLERDIEEALN